MLENTGAGGDDGRDEEVEGGEGDRDGRRVGAIALSPSESERSAASVIRDVLSLSRESVALQRLTDCVMCMSSMFG